jgi:hypothetical protein
VLGAQRLAALFNWAALAAGLTLAAGIALPWVYPPLRRGIRASPLLKAGASVLLGTGPRELGVSMAPAAVSLTSSG